MLKWYKKQGVTIRGALIGALVGGACAIFAAILVGVIELVPIIIDFSPTGTIAPTQNPTAVITPSLTPTLTPSLTPTQVTITPTNTNLRILYEADFSLWGDESVECAEFEFVPEENERHWRIKCLHTDGTSILSIGFLDFDLRVAARKVQGSNRAWYGIVLSSERETKIINHRFFISGLGTYTYEVATFNKDGNQIDLDIIAPAEISPAIITKDATNLIQIIRKRSVVEFRVNNQTLLIIETSISGNEEIRIGPSVITPNENRGGDDFIDIAFKNLIIYEVP